MPGQGLKVFIEQRRERDGDACLGHVGKHPREFHPNGGGGVREMGFKHLQALRPGQELDRSHGPQSQHGVVACQQECGAFDDLSAGESSEFCGGCGAPDCGSAIVHRNCPQGVRRACISLAGALQDPRRV